MEEPYSAPSLMQTSHGLVINCNFKILWTRIESILTEEYLKETRKNNFFHPGGFLFLKSRVGRSELDSLDIFGQNEAFFYFYIQPTATARPLQDVIQKHS